jgi:hypothetical protein
MWSPFAVLRTVFVEVDGGSVSVGGAQQVLALRCWTPPGGCIATFSTRLATGSEDARCRCLVLLETI